MKCVFTVVALVGVATLTTTAAPRLHLNTTDIQPQSEIDLILDKPVISNNQVGKTVPNKLLTAKPALDGELIWKGPAIARFVPREIPKIGTTYTFSITPGNTHLDGTPIPDGMVGHVSTPALQVDFTTTPNRYDENYSLRSGEWYLRFNDQIDPTAAAPFLVFVDKAGNKVPANVRRPIYRELKYPGYVSATWSERMAAKDSAPTEAQKPDEVTPIKNGLLVSPVSPLPIGQEWNLHLLAGLPNADNTSKLAVSSKRWIGNIDPVEITSAEAQTIANQPRIITLRFNANLPKEPTAFASFVTIQPTPANLVLRSKDNELTIDGDFSTSGKWAVEVREGMPTADGRPVNKTFRKELVFRDLEPRIALPSQEEAQLAEGARKYRIETVNTAKLHVRIKKLEGVPLLRALQGYRQYTGNGPNDEEISPQAMIPYELLDGKTVVEQDFAGISKPNTSTQIELQWDELMKHVEGGAPKFTAFFLDVRGIPLEGLTDERKPIAQAIIQLTDLGLAWKVTNKETRIFAYSLQSGQPLSGVNIDFFGEDAQSLTSVATNKNGLATVPRTENARHLRASLGVDQFATTFDNALPTAGLWRFPVRYTWNPSTDPFRRMFLFSDRSLYRPGEVVNLKGILRTQDGNDIVAAKDLPAARLVVTDPADKEIQQLPLTISDRGSFDYSFTVPEEGATGIYNIRVEFSEEVAKAETIEEWDKKEHMMNSCRFVHNVRVEEFRRNAFEVKHEITPPAAGATNVHLDLSASYYQGQPVANGKVQRNVQIVAQNFYPEDFRDFLFGDHREPDYYYWYRYFRYNNEEGHSARDATSDSVELTLDDKGKAGIDVKLPELSFPRPREVTIGTEVTDANNQTLYESSSVLTHGSDLYVGISRLDRLVRVGDTIPLELIAVTSEGKGATAEISLDTALTREVNEQVKLRTNYGNSAVRNESHNETVSTGTLVLRGNAADPTSRGAYEFKPTAPGRYTLTVRGKDAAGRPLVTASSYYVYGSNEYPWAYEDNVRIKLVAEKNHYKPGETARILVLSPIEGTALVTLEREKVTRSMLVPLKADKPVLEIPLSEEEAPNVFVSVLVIKGAKDSARDFKEPQLRLGYCELTVENTRDKLAVNVEAKGETTSVPLASAKDKSKATPSFLPGSEITLQGTVTRNNGSPVANSEVTLYAEDEGTLAVLGYETPNPMAFFYDPRELLVNSGTTLDLLLSESPDEQSFYNKGFFVGGGDDADLSSIPTRKDFNPCALWKPTLVTDAQGRFTTSFKAPDTLTRYRVIAIAHHEASRFGSAETSVVVNKPLMLEAKSPRFAMETDIVEPKVLVQNASAYAGTWTVTLDTGASLNSPVARIIDPKTQQPTNTIRTSITLPAGGSGTISFPVRFENTGELALTWRAAPASLDGINLTPEITKALSDAVETRFPVEFPAPLLRQSKLVRLNKPADAQTMFASLDKSLLKGRGDIQLDLSQSLLMEAGSSVDALLHYPYGCVEQTTSALMPWLAVERLRGISPKLATRSSEEVRKAVQVGADRLLSMQLPEGGFGYWPGSTERVEWASAYAGMGLIMAREVGATVPDSAIAKLQEDLIRSLHGIAESQSCYELENACNAVWVLALSGKPQPAYVNKLNDRFAQLTPRARHMLALSMIAANPQEKTHDNAEAILNSTVAFTGNDDGWMRWERDNALELLAWATIEPGGAKATAALEKLMRDRSPYGEWRTTWCNSWSLLALAKMAEGETLRPATKVVVNYGSDRSEIALSKEQPSGSKRFTLAPDATLSIEGDAPVYARVTVASKPSPIPLKPVAANGMEVTRYYERVKPDGKTEPLTNPKVGDLILVKLRVVLPKDDMRYLVVEDPLPSIFEAVNQDFESQSAGTNTPDTTREERWESTHVELRDSRAVFFFDAGYRGAHEIRYLARCTLPGQATAPAAKVEAMYDPELSALSAPQRFEAK